MLKIGDFSKLSQISIRMLRYYDEIGLLHPQEIDAMTGYRYYSEAQLPEAGRIQMLKNLGFGLNMIREILESYGDAAKLERFLTLKQQELAEQEEQLAVRLRLIDGTLERLRKDGNIMGYEVTLKTLPRRYVASVRQIIPTYAEEGMLWKILMEETAALHIQDGNPCYISAVFYDAGYKEQDVDVEVQKSVEGSYADTEHVRFKTVPAVEVVSCTYKGGYEQMSQVNAAVAKWIHDNGYEMNGPAFWIYHVSPYETQDPAEFVTEVCYPVRKCGV